jgi:hypothetical protein
MGGNKGIRVEDAMKQVRGVRYVEGETIRGE